MLDARTLSFDTTLEADVCILGAGAAGITIARELAGTDLRVCVLESGGLEADAQTQGLYAGANIGHPYPSLISTRLRFFGGSTNHWGGWCAPLDAIDFDVREWVPLSGWPFRREALVPYYERAHVVAQLGPFDYRPGRWATRERPDLDLDPSAGVETAMWQFSPPTRFGQRYRSDLDAARNVQVVLHANATGIELDPLAARVQAVRAATLEGGSFRVTARQFVLALGGIENPRLLLLSDDVATKGVGNDRDLVGRYFMEHPHVTTAITVFEDPDARLRLFSHAGRGAQQAIHYRVLNRMREELGEHELPVPSRAGLRITDEAQRVHRILNGAGVLNEGEPVDGTGVHVQRSIADSAGREPRGYSVRMQLEQAPNHDSRVLLGSERDALGQRRSVLDWRLAEIDRRSMVEATRRIGIALGASGIGRLRPLDWVREDPDAWVDVVGGPHHMGTTRMSTDPRQGVVDARCRVHGVPNLWVAGSSVFPTGGYTNPTLTILALAMRLADDLKAELGAR